jgi:perosamine synthetase
MQASTKAAFIPLARPDIREEDIAEVVKVLRSGMLVQGEYVGRLEKAFAEYHQVEHAIAVSNGTATLHLALHVLGIGKGDEVIVPAFSYAATANVVELVGARCVFVDTEPGTFNIDASAIEAKITAQTKAIIPVHEFGLCCDIEAVCAIGRKHQIPVIEDAACALGASMNGRKAGTFGLLGSFSLHPRKSITSGEGGVLVTNDGAIASKLRQLRNHGIEMREGVMDFVEAGFNYRMTDFQAALAWSQFSRIEEIFLKKDALSEVYYQSINNPAVSLPIVPKTHRHTWQTFHVLLDEKLKQQEIIQKLRSEGIGVNYGAQCIPALSYYQQAYGLDAKTLFPNAWQAYKQGLAIPIYELLEVSDIQYISKLINNL